MGKGVAITTEFGEYRELPPQQGPRGRAPNENEFGYSTVVSEYYTGGNYVDDSELHVLH